MSATDMRLVQLLLVAVAIRFSVVLTETSHTCIHDSLMMQELPNTKRNTMQTDQQYDGLFPDDTNTQPLRILLHTFIDNDAGSTCYNVGDVITISSTQQYVCQKQDILTEENKKYLIGTLLPQAQVTLQRAFKVMPVVGSLFLDNSAKCGFQGGVRVPADYGRGSVGAQNADIVIFVTTRPIIESGNVLAFAGPCQEDQYGRPIAGHLNFNPSAITPSDYATAQQLGTAVHEMTHALGFTSSKFGSINVPVGSGRSASIMTTLNLGIGAGGTSKQVSVINSPNVVEFIRRHFACPNMQGAELEDDGGDGTALSHWEKRVFMNEYMTGSAVTNPVFSELTLAFFQDSGWYRVNYSVAETLYWGRGMGCSFAQQSCGSWPTQRGYFCEKNGAVGCTPDYVGKGQCVVNTYASDLPADSRYFSDPKKGGGSRLADFCPYVTAYDNGWCFASDMNTEMRLIDDGEFFSPASRCFISTLAKNIPFGSEQKPVCYETYCTDNNELKVRVGQTWYNCPAGGAIPIVGYGGLLTCPSNVSDLCSDAFAHYIGPYPVFFNITPTAGGPGTVVTINGKNFPPYVTVKISAMCENVTVISPNQIIASIPFITDVNPAQIIAELETVVITDPKGRTALGHKSFLLDVGYNGDYVDNTFNWVGKRWILGVALSVAVVIASIACAICCYQQ